MQERKIISAAISGTSAMTLFSKAASAVKGNNFSEPEILGRILCELMPDLKPQYARIAGWNIHYAVGFMFTMLYSKIIEERKRKTSLKSGIILGFLSGLVGIFVWKLVLGLSKSAGVEDKSSFYRHIWVAHLVFGAFTAVGYQMLTPQNAEKLKELAAKYGIAA